MERDTNISTNEKLIVSNGPEETKQTAMKLAAALRPGDVLALSGPLGSGKTCFVQGLAEGLGIKERVTSPTFTLVREYKGRLALRHVDLYRLKDAPPAAGPEIDEIFEPNAVIAIEWPENVEKFLPSHTNFIFFEHGEQDRQRIIRIRAP